MRTRKTVRIILCVVAVLAIVFALTACREKDVIVSNPTTTVNSNSVGNVNTAQTTGTQAQTNQRVCYWCGELPVGDFETYCVNCRCVKCDDLRKNGGVGGYLYCMEHNCNENNCEEPAADDSQYCVLHKCSYPDCDLEKTANSEYCYTHSN